MTEEELFADALELTDPKARAELLGRACAGDAALRSRVEKLLALHAGHDSFLAPADVDPLHATTSEWRVSPAEPTEGGTPISASSAPATAALRHELTQLPTIPGYDVLEQIGRGGMGIVLKAHDIKLKREVAIKLLAPQLSAKTEAVQRFLREGQSAARVRHENVVTIFSVDDSSPTPFLVMEYIKGESLQDRLNRDGPLPPPEAAEIARQVALGLAAAHAKGLVHRDVKPGNVLLEQRDGVTETTAPHVKLTDFGLARAVDDVGLTQSGFLAGTPQYMSPEQAESTSIDHRTDLFSLGGVLYAMLAGAPPFVGTSTASTLRLIVDRPPADCPSRKKPQAARLWVIVDKLLAKRPEHRFQSAEEVIEALSRFLNDRSGSTAHASSRKSVARVRPLHLVTAVVIAALMVLFVSLNWPPQQQPEAATNSVSIAETGKKSDSGNESAADVLPAVVPPTVPKVEELKLHPIISDDFEWMSAENLGSSVNSPGNEDHSGISADGLTLVFTRYANREGELWLSQREKLGDAFEEAQRLPDAINSTGADSDPFVTADGLSLWFSSSRPGGLGNTDLYEARRETTNSSFTEATLIPSPLSSGDFDSSPCLSPDGLSLYFGRGATPRRLFVATRSTTDSAFGEPRELSSLNQGRWHEFPRILPDGLTLVFVASHSEAQHLFVATRSSKDGEFGGITNLGPMINDVYSAISGPSWCEAESALYFSSQRPGGQGKRDLWRARRVKKSEKSKLAPPQQTNPNEPPFAIAPFTTEQVQQSQAAWAAHLKTEPTIENSIGMKLKLIPPGEFLMGASDDDPEAQLHERPQHPVRLTRPFFMSATEITVGEFRQFVEAAKYVTAAEADGQGASDVNPKVRRPVLVWNKLPTANTDEFPVRCVGWEDAVKFCEWLSQQEGHEYRLPTEAEWEFACRAGTTTRYVFGNQFVPVKANSSLGSPDGSSGLRPVGTYEPNAFGLHDMHGNLNEICWDSGRIYAPELSIDPIGSLNLADPAVVRGGAMSSIAARLRSSQRYCSDGRMAPEQVFATPVKGFRVVRVMPPSQPR